MTTITSFSKESRFLPMYRLALRQNAGYFGLASLLIFLFYPLQFLMEIFKKIPQSGAMEAMRDLPADPYYDYQLYGLGRNFTSVSMILFTMVFLLLPFVLSLMLNSYMHSKKAADVYHSLPVKREVLLGVNAAVAMTIVTVPLVISNVIVAAAALVKFGVSGSMGYQFLDMLCWLACAFLIYAVTTCVCTQVGTVFDTFLFSGILFFVLPIIVWTAVLLGNEFLYGYAINSNVWRMALRLSPVLFPIERFMFNFDYFHYGYSSMEEVLQPYLTASNITMVLYIAAAVLLILLAMRLYTRRPSERAETTSSRGVLATFIHFAGTLLGGVYAGVLFYAMDNSQSKLVYLVWCAIGGIVCFALLEVILNRGFKTLLRKAPRGGVMVAVGLALSTVMMTGGLGYENRVPKLESLEAVQINWYGSYGELGREILRSENNFTVDLTTQEAMKAIIDYQKSLIDEKYERNAEALEAAGKRPAYAWMDITYQKSGGEMRRTYDEASTDNLASLIPLELSEEFQKQANPFFLIDFNEIVSWNITDAFGWEENLVKLSSEDNARLLEAVKADYLALDREKAAHPETTVTAHLTVQVLRPIEELNRALSRSELDYYSTRNDVYEAYTPVSGPNTERVLRELNLLPQKPDLSDCAGAYVENSGALRSVSGSMIIRINSGAASGTQSYQNAKEESARLALEDPDYQTRYDTGYRELYIEDPEQMAALADNLVSSWSADEPYLIVNFYQKKEGGLSRRMLVPVSRLPVSLQKLVDPGPASK